MRQVIRGVASYLEHHQSAVSAAERQPQAVQIKGGCRVQGQGLNPFTAPGYEYRRQRPAASERTTNRDKPEAPEIARTSRRNSLDRSHVFELTDLDRASLDESIGQPHR